MSIEVLPPSFIETHVLNVLKASPKAHATHDSGKSLHVLLVKDSKSLATSLSKILSHLSKESLSILNDTGFLPGKEEDHLLVKLDKIQNRTNGSMGFLNESLYGHARDSLGSKLVKNLDKKYKKLRIRFEKLPEAAILGGLVGLELSQYSFKKATRELKDELHDVTIEAPGVRALPQLLKKAQRLGQAANLARHLVNLPPNELNPVSYAQAIQKLFASSRKIKVEVWDEKRLAKENLTLIGAVGQGSSTPPRLVRISYRPKGFAKTAPLVFVGKGITFDSGGLDIKPSNYMRLMKKDMGGSASVVGLAYWLEASAHQNPVDLYVALAENAIGSRSFRPGDVYKSRKGHSVEIDNTDAEGRLVLADAITVALEESKPKTLIDIATLTGAGKVALGTDVASLFCNDDKLQKALLASCQATQDWAWPLPLFEKYNSMFSSVFGDFANSATSSYGGAITAALFLKKFIDPSPIAWAHFDIYGWKDSSEGAFAEKGGNAQCVQALAHWLGDL
jgi:leucyl aminopeptidase